MVLALSQKFLQSKVNSLCKRALKFTLNPVVDDKEEEKDEQEVFMEEGGFTVVKKEQGSFCHL